MLMELIETLEKNNVIEYGIEKGLNVITGKKECSVWIENTPQEIFDYLDTKRVIRKESCNYSCPTIYYIIVENGIEYDITTWQKIEEESEPDWDNLDWDDNNEEEED
jgi:hypothetical protein